ncbi:hypothetical protein ACL07V_01905 [Streptomyces sp. MB22_4]|uniref:hypothetical protein n=1 Tax=Streptomyces sp. MB22_4 TaxID=3383120 RepID=UPI00399FFAF4
MAAQREQEPGGAPDPRPVPRDMPDQEARPDDPWDLPADRSGGPTGQDEGDDADGVPDTDEAGSGPRGAPRKGTVHPEHPGPDESPA